MLYQNPAIQSRVEVHFVEEAKGGPSKLLLSFLLCSFHLSIVALTELLSDMKVSGRCFYHDKPVSQKNVDWCKP
jgi:hypothetical protein